MFKKHHRADPNSRVYFGRRVPRFNFVRMREEISALSKIRVLARNDIRTEGRSELKEHKPEVTHINSQINSQITSQPANSQIKSEPVRLIKISGGS